MIYGSFVFKLIFFYTLNLHMTYTLQKRNTNKELVNKIRVRVIDRERNRDSERESVG